MKRLVLFITSTLFCLHLTAQQPKIMVPIGHTNDITSAEFSQDSKYIISTSYDKTAAIWEAASGSLLYKLYHSDIVRYGFFSHDGKRIVTSPFDSTAIIWDAFSQKSLHKIKSKTGRITYANFSPDDKKLLTIDEDFTRQKVSIYGRGSINIWDSSGKLIHRLDSIWGIVNSAVFSPDGEYLLAEYEIREDFGERIYYITALWNVTTGKISNIFKGSYWAQFNADGKSVFITTKDSSLIIEDFHGIETRKLVPPGEKFNLISLSSDTKYIATMSDSLIVIRETSTGNIIGRLPGRNRQVSASFSPDDKYFVSISDNVSIIWDIAGGRAIDTLKDWNFLFHFANFSPNGKYLISPSNEDKNSQNEYKIQLREMPQRNLLQTLSGHTRKIEFSKYSPDGYILTVVHTSILNTTVFMWDASTGKLLYWLKEDFGEIINATFIPGGKFITISKDDNIARVWQTGNGKLLQTFKGNFREAVSIDFSPDGKYVVVGYGSWMHTSSSVFSTGSGKQIKSLSDQNKAVLSVKFSPNGKSLAVSYADDSTIIRNTRDFSITRKISGHVKGRDLLEAGEVYSTADPIAFSADGKYIATLSWAGSVKIWEVVSGKLVSSIKKLSWRMSYFAAFSKDAKYLITDEFSDSANVWDVKSGDLLYRLIGHSERINSVDFSPDNKYILTSSEDNTNKKWDIKTGKLLYTFFILDNSDYFLYLPSGYYMSTQKAAKLLHYVDKDLKVISFEQLDVKYNRPDKVLEAIGNKDSALIQSYRNAYYKRIERLHFNINFFGEGYSVPDCDFANRGTIDDSIAGQRFQKGDQLSLHIVANDKADTLDRFNVWVNEVPVYGAQGVSIRHEKKKTLDTTVTITLSQGENRIESSVFNANATESYRKPLLVNYASAQALKDTLYFIGIGVNQYINKTSRNLSFAAKDIRDLDTLFRMNAKTVISKIFIDSAATRDSILAVKKILLNTGVNDKVVIALSGHGVLYEKKDFYFGTYDIDFDKPNEKGLKYEELESLLADIPARRKLLLIDACHSGEVDTSVNDKDKSTDNTNAAKTDSAVLNKTPIKKGDPDRLSENSIGLDNSFELMKEVFADLSRSNGAVVISAARGLGYAEEDSSWNNGAFTLCIKAAFLGNAQFQELKETADKNGDGVSINELKDYILTKVPLLTKDRQKPTTRRENIEVDWKLW